MPSPTLLVRREGYAVGVFTDPSWRGLGIATSLMRLAFDEARHRGMVRIRLRATEKGWCVYSAQGFRARDDEMEIVL